MKHLWVAEYSPNSDKLGAYPWHIGTLAEHVRDNVSSVLRNGDIFDDWYIIGGPFESDDEAHECLNKIKARLGWEWKENGTKEHADLATY